MANMFELQETVPEGAVIKVIGVGGGGGNAVAHMLHTQVDGVDFICANTDAQALRKMGAECTLLQLGSQVTRGLGAGANPEIGRQAAVEDRDRIMEMLQGADMVFITAGMGGGTGTGGAPIIAEIARDMGILTVGVVTKPFPFEGKKRMLIAEQGIQSLSQHVDSLITIPNAKLLSVLGANVSLLDAFKSANDVLHGAVKGIADLILHPGQINVDFADVKTVMSEMGLAMMGTGTASGENRAREAAEKAIHSPLLDDIRLDGARGILVSITADHSLTLGEFTTIGEMVQAFASDVATVVVGTTLDPNMGGDVHVTVVATGLGQAEQQAPSARDSMRVVSAPRASGAATPDYRQYDRQPAVARQQQVANGGARQAAHTDIDYLDIPAFLRHQAD